MIHRGPDHRINRSGYATTIKLVVAGFSLRTNSPSIFISSAVNVIVEHNWEGLLLDQNKFIN